jgi:hypothetical protein
VDGQRDRAGEGVRGAAPLQLGQKRDGLLEEVERHAPS